MGRDDEAPPPPLRSWRPAYGVVLGALAVEVLLLTLLSRAW